MNKLQNTLENKARFFALYWNQRCWVRHHPNGEVAKLYVNADTLSAKGRNIASDYLELTPLSQISDEDAVEVAKIVGEKFNFRYTGEKYLSWFRDKSNFNSRVTDYLRSKGYALPWMGLSVDDLVQMGWVKLKEGENKQWHK